MRPITPDRVKRLSGGNPIRGLGTAGKILTLSNVLLALYNFMCFSVPRNRLEPCVVVLNNTQLQTAAENGLLQVSEIAAQPLKRKTNVESSATLTQEFRGDHVVLANYIRAKGAREDFNKSVTYSTQATHEFFFPHVSELCKRWQGPISLAVYAPGSDFAVVNRLLAHQIQCDPCIASNVSFHIVYHGKHTPPNIPDNPQKYIASLEFDCQNPPHSDSNYRSFANLSYPINVLRNVARLHAETKYILASDIELYPSMNIIPRFIKLMESIPSTKGASVYTLPIFEVEKAVPVPQSKSELAKLYFSRKAVFFHRYVCDICQNFPKRDDWIHRNETNSSSPFSIFGSLKRRKDRSSWEPIYIGTNDEPLYAEELSWEGKRDKMSQMYELCLKDYEFKILDDAFLCHAPGVKKLNRHELVRRAPYVRRNNAFYPKILSKINNRNKNGVKPELCI